MIGRITEIIAADNINISDTINKSRGDIAYIMIDIDSGAEQKLLDDLAGIPGLIRIRVL